MTTDGQDVRPAPPELPDAEAEKSALRQQINALELRLAEVEAELVATRSASRPIDVGAALLLAATCLLALVPPVLVFIDRWLMNRQVLDLWRSVWCRSESFCRSAYPAYFLVIFPCLLLCVPLVWLLVRRLPEGWLIRRVAVTVAERYAARKRRTGLGQPVSLRGRGLRHRPDCDASIDAASRPGMGTGGGLRGLSARLGPPGDAGRQDRRWGTALARAGWAQSCWPRSRCCSSWPAAMGNTASYWITAILLLLAAANLWRYRRAIPPIVWIATLALVLYSVNMNAWWLSAIGDEYSFWSYAREIAEKQRLSFIGASLFNGQAVYGAHPYLSSLIQALFMKLFGSDGFGWRISNSCLSAAAVLFFYLFARTFVTRRTALMAALFLAISHYIMSFGKIGYNNLQALFAETLVLAAAAWAVRTRRLLAFALLGAGLGFCFYVYPAALYVLPLPVLLLLFYVPPVSRAAIGRWAVTAISAIILVIPLLAQPGYWQAKIAGTLFYNPEITQTALGIAAHFSRNFLYAALSHLYAPHETHFVVVSYVDPLTAALAWIGIACFLWLAVRERFAAFFVIGFAALLFLVGASHDRQFPTATRMFLLLPWYALFAAAGLTWLLSGLQSVGLARGRGRGLVVLVFIVVLGLNLYQAYPLARDRMGGLQSLETLFLRTVQRAQRDEAVAPKTYVFVTDPSWSSIGIQMIPEVYPVRAKITEVVISDPSLPESAIPLIADRNALVIIKPWLDPSWQEALAAPLSALGKVPCPIHTTNGDVRFTLWHAPENGWLCQ